MKSLYFSALFFVLIFVVVSHADNHDHLIKSSSNGGDSLIRLPVEEEADENNKPQQKQQTQLETTSFSNSHVIDVEKYLTELMNRRPVMLPTRFRFPRRCGHRFRRFGPGIQVGPGDDVASIFKKRADVILQRHVAGRFFGGEFLIIPVKHFHRFHHGVRDHDDHHHHHHGEVDPTVEMKREYEFEVKEEYDGHHHHHQHHDHGHDDEVEENNGIMKKILKFLPRF